MKRTLAALIFAGVVSSAGAQDAAGDESYFAILGDGLVKADDKHIPELDGGFGLDLRYGVRPSGILNFGYEFRTFYGKLQPKLDRLKDGNRGGIGADLLLPVLKIGPFTPYALAGLGMVYNDSLPEHDQVGFFVNGGLGVFTGIVGNLGLPFRLRGEARASFEDYREEYLDLRAFIGVEIPWSVPVPPPAPEPIAVVEPVAPVAEPAPEPIAPPPAPVPAGPQDSDEDGVDDDVDRCPDSPKGKPVDSEGCTILKVLTLRGVTFEVGSDRLKPESAAVLDEAVATLNKEFPDARIEVAGHTDSTGKDAYNMKLSQRRAQAVLNYLVTQGVDSARLNAQGYGKTEPVDTNDTAAGRSLNRRVELRVKGDPAPEPLSLNPNSGD